MSVIVDDLGGSSSGNDFVNAIRPLNAKKQVIQNGDQIWLRSGHVIEENLDDYLGATQAFYFKTKNIIRSGLSNHYGIAFDGTNYYTAQNSTKLLKKISPSGATIATLNSGSKTDYTRALAIDSTYIYILQINGNGNGVYITKRRLSDNALVSETSTEISSRVVVSAQIYNGYLYALMRDGVLVKIDTTTLSIVGRLFSGISHQCNGIAIFNNTVIIMTSGKSVEYTFNDDVSKLTATGRESTSNGGSGYDPINDLVMSDPASIHLREITPFVGMFTERTDSDSQLPIYTRVK